MKRQTFQLVAFTLVALLLSVTASAAVKVIAVTGSAEIKVDEASGFQQLMTGDEVPLGATIRTGADGNVFLTPLPGITSTVSPGSELVIESASVSTGTDGKPKQSAMLDLRKGNMTNTLEVKGTDTDFKIKTPKGVAAARGTIFQLDETGGLSVLEGNVDKDGQSYPEGSIVYTDPVTGQTASTTNFADLPASVKTQVAAAAAQMISQQATLAATGTGQSAGSAAKTAVKIAAKLSDNPGEAVKAATKAVLDSASAAGVDATTLTGAIQTAVTAAAETLDAATLADVSAQIATDAEALGLDAALVEQAILDGAEDAELTEEELLILEEALDELLEEDPEVIDATFTVTIDQPEGGTIDSSDPLVGIESGTIVTFTATSDDPDYFEFGDWTGGVTGTADSGTLEVTQSTTVSAEFDYIGPIDFVSIEVNSTNGVTGGSVSGGGEFREYDILNGDSVVITATPASSEFEFIGWDGDVMSNSSTLDISSLLIDGVDTDLFIDATFAPVASPAAPN